MCLTNKILVGLIVVIIIPYLYFASITMKTHSEWRSAYNRLNKELEEQKAINHRYLYGEGQKGTDDFVMSVPEQRLRLARLQSIRGNQSWTNCIPNSVSVDAVELEVPTPEGGIPLDAEIVPQGSRFYAFENPEDEESVGRYMGIFFVTNCDGGIMTLAPDPMEIKDSDMVKKLQSSNAESWTICSSMPLDSHDIFADADEEIFDLLPKDSVDDFKRDGKETDEKGEKFERELTSYDTMFELLMIKRIDDAAQKVRCGNLAKKSSEFTEVLQNQVTLYTAKNSATEARSEMERKGLDFVLGCNSKLSREIATLDAKKRSYVAGMKTDAMKIWELQNQQRKNSPPVPKVQ